MSFPAFGGAGTIVSGVNGISTAFVTVTPAWPTHAVGDIAFCLALTNNTVDPGAATTASTGWTSIGTQGSTSGGNFIQATLFWCRATTSSMPAPSITSGINTAGTTLAAQVFTSTGAIASGTPYDITSSTPSNANKGSISIAGATTSTANTLVLMAVGETATGTFSAVADASLGSVTKNVDNASGGMTLCVGSGTFVGPGAYGAFTATASNAGVWSGWTFAVKGPAVVVGPGLVTRKLPPWMTPGKFAATKQATGGKMEGAGTSTGSSSATGVLAAQGAMVGSSAGNATPVSGVIAANAATVGSSAGSASPSGVMTATAQTTGSSAGSASTSGVIAANAATIGNAAGSASTSGVASEGHWGNGTSAGSASATGTIAALASVVGSSAGVASGSGVLAAIAKIIGNAAGLATTSGISAAVAATIGTSAGFATVSGGPVLHSALIVLGVPGNYYPAFGTPGDFWGGYWGTPRPPSSANIVNPTIASGAGANRATLIGSRPKAPLHRDIPGAVGTTFNETRVALGEMIGKDELWGNHVDVTFATALTPVKVSTGLGGPARGYYVTQSNADVRVFNANNPNPADTSRGYIWLQATAPAKLTLYIY